MLVRRTLLFGSGRSQPDTADLRPLHQTIDSLRADGSVAILIEGHADKQSRTAAEPQGRYYVPGISGSCCTVGRSLPQLLDCASLLCGIDTSELTLDELKQQLKRLDE